jgi:hypothetical protein
MDFGLKLLSHFHCDEYFLVKFGLTNLIREDFCLTLEYKRSAERTSLFKDYRLSGLYLNDEPFITYIYDI